MTCIAGITEKGHVYLGGDSAVSNTWTTHVAVGGKVFRLGEFIVGCAGDKRYADLMRYSLKPPPIERGQDIEAYMTTVFVDTLRETLRLGGHLETFNTQEGASGIMLVGVRGNLFNIDSCFSALRSMEGFNAIGSGDMVALGALHVTKELAPEERIKRALEAAERWADGVRAPFTIEFI